jgi:hypothetical protein
MWHPEHPSNQTVAILGFAMGQPPIARDEKPGFAVSPAFEFIFAPSGPGRHGVFGHWAL